MIQHTYSEEIQKLQNIGQHFLQIWAIQPHPTLDFSGIICKTTKWDNTQFLELIDIYTIDQYKGHHRYTNTGHQKEIINNWKNQINR